MLDAVGHDEELALFQFDDSVAELDPHPAAPDEEKLILDFMVVPEETPGI